MQAFEFHSHLNPGNTLTVPEAIAGQLQAQQSVRVILLVSDREEERDWLRFGNEQFLKGYAESDAIYDQL